MKKRLISALLVLVMVLTMLPVTAMAAENENTVTYYLDGDPFGEEDTITEENLDSYELRKLETEDGKEIDGWYETSDYSGDPVTKLEGLKDYKLYGMTVKSDETPDPTDPEPDPTDPEPDPTDPEPDPIDPEPDPADPDPEPDPEPTDPDVLVVVTFDPNNGEPSFEKELTVGEPYGELPVPTNGNLVLDGWYRNEGKEKVTADTLVLDYNHKLTASWISADYPNNTAEYTVEHWIEKWNRKTGKLEYVLEDSVTYTADVGGYVTVQPKSYDHYGLNKDMSVTSGVVTADGKLVLKLFYDQVFYIRYTDGIPGVKVFEDQVYTAGYGDPTPKFNDRGNKLGWYFLGWYPEVSKTVTGDVTYVAQWLNLCWNVSNVKKPTTPMAFTDVSKSDWFYSDVKYVYENGLMEGTSDTKFSPNATLTRGMVATILYRMDGAPKTRYNGMFSDVANYKWYTDGVEWAAAKGIVEGFEDGKFRPNEPVTREQLATMLYRYATYKGYTTSARVDLDKYKDADSIHSYAVTAVRWALAEDLLSASNGSIQPRVEATRAEVAVSVSTFCQTIT